MSRPNSQNSRTVFASKTAYEGLQVDSGEESEEEERPSDLDKSIARDSIPQEPAKMTKSAMKKAQRIARLEQKQRQKELKALKRSGSEALSDESVNSSALVQEHGTAMDEQALRPVGLSSAVRKPATELPDVATEVKQNGSLRAASDEIQLGSAKAPSTAHLEDKKPSLAQLASGTPEASVPVDTPASRANGLVATSKTGTGPPSPQDAEKSKKRQNALTRTLWTFIMIGGFIVLLLLGHAYMILLVMLCQTLVYREVTALFSLKTATPQSRDAEPLKGKDPWSKTLNWYFFAVTNYFLYGESIIYYFKHVVFADANLLPFATNHRMISFTLYTIGFMGFVMSLKKGYLKQQFSLFCWVHMSLLLIVVSSHFIVNNILEGLIWFWVPASLVICNDIFAYIWGVTIGRTPLIKLSPKKTVEGFVGAFISTVIFGALWGSYFMQFDYMICPVHDLGVSAWSSTHCSPNPVFVSKTLDLWPPLSTFLSTLSGYNVKTISYVPYQLHLLVLSCFASLVAPFGGFFASGFKRAFNIKDFGHSIPGHGGMTDRMDCQFLMGVFTYVYYSSLIRVHQVTVGGILQTVVSGLTVEQQLELIRDLKSYLEGQGVRVS